MTLTDAERQELAIHLMLAITDRVTPDAREDKRCREWIARLRAPWYDSGESP